MSMPEHATLAAEVVKTMIANGHLTSPGQVPELLKEIGTALQRLQVGGLSTQAVVAAPVHLTAVEAGQQPAVPIRESVQPEFIVCLEDGKKMKMLRRYVQRVHGMTPDQYRAKWQLPKEYPLVAPNYAKQKSRWAKRIGLGTHAMRQAAGAKNQPVAA